MYYCITDPDIELYNIRGDMLEICRHFCDMYDGKRVIGPMLHIDDIPDGYPRKAMVIESHTKQFWHKKPLTKRIGKHQVNYQLSSIDTTFQFISRKHPEQNKFPRDGVRLYAPYSARHLDWYIIPNKMTEDQLYYSRNATSTAHWSKDLKV
jgi:hypothetical protein